MDDEGVARLTQKTLQEPEVQKTNREKKNQQVCIKNSEMKVNRKQGSNYALCGFLPKRTMLQVSVNISLFLHTWLW